MDFEALLQAVDDDPILFDEISRQPGIEAYFAEQGAAVLRKDLGKNIDLVSLPKTPALIFLAEEVFGYEK